MARRKGQTGDPCRWTENADGVWVTDCGHMFELTDGTPSDNKLVFCAYCGRKLTQRPVKGF
jgi:hypothetical protein